MASLRQFAKRIRHIGLKVGQNGPDIARKAALAVDQVVVLATPVDTGAARSNWQVQVGAPIREARSPYFPGKDGSSAAANTQAAITQGRVAISSFKGNGQIYISNSLPYIGKLNQGSSAQAPENFVEIAVGAGLRAAGQAKILDGDR